MWKGQLGVLPTGLKMWIPSLMGKTCSDPTFLCAIVLATGWKEYSHTQPLSCCHRSVSTDAQRGQKLPYIKERDEWLNYSLFSLEILHIRKDKDTEEWHHESLGMETLIRLYSFVATKNASNLNRQQLWYAGKITALGVRQTLLSHTAILSASDWTDQRIWAFSQGSHEEVKTCVWMYFTNFRAWCKRERRFSSFPW